MKIIAKYSLYKKMMRSSPQVMDDTQNPERYWRRIKWKFDDKYIIYNVHDIKYDWHTVYVHDSIMDQRVACFSGFFARKIFNHLGKSL